MLRSNFLRLCQRTFSTKRSGGSAQSTNHEARDRTGPRGRVGKRLGVEILTEQQERERRRIKTLERKALKEKVKNEKESGLRKSRTGKVIGGKKLQMRVFKVKSSTVAEMVRNLRARGRAKLQRAETKLRKRV
ncbi:hypothetical protein NDN08_000148 [Rhodosorus marinus]|uniref:Uncharacterized protein n=1 Tax=Rhodosorus marinus TaxID=101924 RepID=A0AAV8UFR4_9RHOD|nr:hypothetical protein NDN08_000148 [Rhodosorus marinus]